MLTIAVDAMGGDHAPKSRSRRSDSGGRRASDRRHSGRPGRRRSRRSWPSILRRPDLPIEVHHASEFITMEDSAAKAVRTKKDSSIRVACAPGARRRRAGRGLGRQHRRGDGHRQDGPGHDPRRDRPGAGRGLSLAERNAGGGAGRRRQRRLHAGDAGAVRRDGRDLFAHHFPQLHARAWAALDRRRRAQGQRSHPRRHCRCSKPCRINFIGNVEGRDIFSGIADVVVCDGFIGNVALKVSEGLVDMIRQHAARIARSHHDPQDRLRCSRARLTASSRSAWIIPNTAARRCWA